MIDLSRCRLQPYPYQVEGIQHLVDQPYFFLADTMGLGKSLQVIVAAQILFEQGIIDRVLVIAPASVKNVWYCPDFGELKKHLWISSTIQEFHARSRTWQTHSSASESAMRWLITNFEFIRSKNRLTQLLPYCTAKTLLVLDESSAVKTHNAEQTKAVRQLRAKCGRVTLLNGTPISQSPLDLFSQANLMDPSILDCKYIIYFKARYAVLGGYKVNGRPTQIVKWINMEDLQRRMKPYTLRRLKEDHLKDLPPKLPPVTLTATLTDATWKHYVAMRNEMITFLEGPSVSVAQQAMTKMIRLSQITSGFLGGVED